MNKKPVFLVIAGTVYGRKLSQYLCDSGANVYATVATEYGECLMQPHDNLNILSGRLTSAEMEELIRKINPDAVINTAHPYAAEVSENIKIACENTNVYYIRQIRDENSTDGLIYAGDLSEAAKWLSNKDGNIFSTCGSKEMHMLTEINGFQKRVFLRALPMADFIKNSIELGFSPANLICMQGPFSKDMNKAMLTATNAKYLITKNSGSAGGFDEKISAAKELGITTIVVGRPPQQSGYSYNEIIAIISDKFDLQNNILNEAASHYFPMFISLKGKNVKIFGAGEIAKRRIETLKKFDCSISVFAPVSKLDDNNGISMHNREYKQGDCKGADLVVAATDDSQVNKQIAKECNETNIPVSVCDDSALCTFYFPSVIIQDNIVIGLTSSGKDHKKVKNTADYIRELMKNENNNSGKP